MKSTIYNLVWDNDEGTGCQSFGTREERAKHLSGLLLERADELDPPQAAELRRLIETDPEKAAPYWNQEQKGTIDWFILEESEVTIPQRATKVFILVSDISNEGISCAVYPTALARDAALHGHLVAHAQHIIDRWPLTSAHRQVANRMMEMLQADPDFKRVGEAKEFWANEVNWTGDSYHYFEEDILTPPISASLLTAVEALLKDYQYCRQWAHDNGEQWVGSSQCLDHAVRLALNEAATTFKGPGEQTPSVPSVS